MFFVGGEFSFMAAGESSGDCWSEKEQPFRTKRPVHRYFYIFFCLLRVLAAEGALLVGDGMALSYRFFSGRRPLAPVHHMLLREIFGVLKLKNGFLLLSHVC